MPTNRRYRARRRTPQRIERDHIEALACGNELADLLTPPLDDPRGLWQRIREPMLRAFAKHHPGRRPWAWWEFEATQPRERVVMEGPQAVPSPLKFGYPTGYDGCAVDLNTLYESEADYLGRLGLLMEGEQAAADSTGEAAYTVGASDACISEIMEAIAE